MPEIKKTYLRMLRLEIEDLREDFDLLIKEYNDHHKDEELSQYVFSENITVVQRELLGVNAFTSLLEETDPEKFDSLDDLIAHLSATFKKLVKTSSLPEIIDSYIERKLQKLKEYVLARQKDAKDL